MKKNSPPVEGVIRRGEDIYWKGRPEKTAFMFYDVKDYICELFLKLLFDIILVPFMIVTLNPFGPAITIALFILWGFHAIDFFKLAFSPIVRAREWKNIYYVITNKHFYIQFGSDKDIFYRMYPIDRIGTKVFYRKNSIDSLFGVGTIGISVDDYYEERVVSVKDFEDVYKIFKGFTDVRSAEEMQKALQQAQIDEEEERLEQEMLAEEKRRADELARKRAAEAYNLDLTKESSYSEITDTLEDQINSTPKFETYEEYKKRSRDLLEESRREELRREEAKRRAAEARYRSQMRLQETERKKEEIQRTEVNVSNDHINEDALSEMMAMQEMFVENANATNNNSNKNKNKNKKKNTQNKRGKANYDISTIYSKPTNYDKKVIEEAKKVIPEDVENLDLSGLWTNNNS